ncbi:MAG: hypothetical protein TYPL_1310 [Candidatus Tyloplasma litorale]|nr:MAG: hypothetical protein TYPL_1310 [Mycoplasmatales bacterium]
MKKRIGRNLENNISNKLLKINKSGRGFFIKSSTPIKMIKKDNMIVPIYANKALCDFVGIYNTKFILIEAKNISGKRFEFNRLKEHQEKQLSTIKRHGGFSFIMFGLIIENIIVILEIDDYLVFKSQTERKSIDVETLKEIGTKISIEKIEEYIDNKTK